MKKLLFVFAFTLLSVISYSQTGGLTKLSTYKNVIGRWNDYRNDYDMNGEYRYSKITFTFYDTYVQADDEAKSIYRFVKHFPKEVVKGKEMSWAECLDENNRKCNIILVVSQKPEDSFIIVQYTEIAYFYVLY